jgi:broad specificity phosphatase PhoE
MPKAIEIRRHSLRRPPSPHLTQEGVSLARRAGEHRGPFDRVVTSTAPRAFETAIAMGFAVDEQAELISTLPDTFNEILPYPQHFAEYQGMRRHPVVAKHLHKLAQFYANLALSIPEGGSALVVNHGGIVELSAIACLPDADYQMFGPQAECCEGVRLTWDAGKFVSVETIRIK